MVLLGRVVLSNPVAINRSPEPLSINAYGSFGDVIMHPEGAIGAQITTMGKKTLTTVLTNQGTAFKTSNISNMVNLYESAPSGKKSSPRCTLFRCTPPIPRLKRVRGKTFMSLNVFERHPYTTQAFVPMGRFRDNRAYMVVVAKDKGKSGSLSIHLFVSLAACPFICL